MKVMLEKHVAHAWQSVYSKDIPKMKLTKLLDKQENTKDIIDLSREQLQKWVVNLSQGKLTNAETMVLVKGLNFSISLDKIHVEDFIIETEKVLSEEKKEQLRVEIRGALKSAKPAKSNISKQERAALKDLMTIAILSADKRRATVVMDLLAMTRKSRC